MSVALAAATPCDSDPERDPEAPQDTAVGMFCWPATVTEIS